VVPGRLPTTIVDRATGAAARFRSAEWTWSGTASR